MPTPVEDILKANEARQSTIRSIIEAERQLRLTRELALHPLLETSRQLEAIRETAMRPFLETVRQMERIREAAIRPFSDTLRQVQQIREAAILPFAETVRQMEQIRALSMQPMIETAIGLDRLRAAVLDSMRPALDATQSLRLAREEVFRSLQPSLDAFHSLRALTDSFAVDVIQQFSDDLAFSLQHGHDDAEIEEAKELVAALLEDSDTTTIGISGLLDRLFGLLDRIENRHAQDLVKGIILILIGMILNTMCTCEPLGPALSRSDAIREVRVTINLRREAIDCSTDLCAQIRIVTHRTRVHAGPRARAQVIGLVHLQSVVVAHEKRGKWVRVTLWNKHGNEIEGWVRSKYLVRVRR